MENTENDIKIESIFAITEVRRYIADVIDENIKEFDLPIGEFEWSLAFLETYKKFKTGEDEEISEGQNNSTEISNYILSHSKQHTFVFLRGLFKLIALLEKKEIIESSEQFTGEMFAFMFDPERSYLEKESREKIIKDIKYIFIRHGWNIRFNNILNKYIFEKSPIISPIDKNTIFLYGDNIYISCGSLYFININKETIQLETDTFDIKMLIYLVGIGKGDPNNWLKNKDIADSLDSKSIKTVCNHISHVRTKISSFVGVDIIEERGSDKSGKEYRINPKMITI